MGDNYSATQFDNGTFFIFPLRILNKERFMRFLEKDQRWTPQEKMRTQYLLRYAADMNDPSDDRLQRFMFCDTGSLPVYMFDSFIKGRMEELGLSSSGETASLKDVSLYVFGDDTAFLELRVDYGMMNLAEIAEFIYLFRSLRNDESKPRFGYPEGTVGVVTAINSMLPEKDCAAELCFSNKSDLKKQAIVYTVLNTTLCCEPDLPEKDADNYRYLISHGFNMGHLAGSSFQMPYEMAESFRDGEYWGGCQDGLVCMEKEPYIFQYQHLCEDYHFLYLLLLNQRFSIIAYIDELRKEGPDKEAKDLERIQEISKRVVTLKIRYAFRIISDDAYMQTIYNKLYDVLEIDHLLKDVDEAGEQLNEILQRDQNRRGRRFEGILTALSILTLFSAIVDLTDYLEKFSTGKVVWPVAGLVINLAIMIIALTLIFRRKD